MMFAIQDNKNINLKSAQIKFCIDHNLISYDHDCDWILQKLSSSINNKTIATANIASNNPQLIGCTPLHFALLAKNAQAFDTLLNYGADFTAKNSSGYTALHLAIKQWCSNNSDFSFSDSQIEILFTHLTLTTHIQYERFCNPYDRNKYSHFHAACMINYTEVVHRFLQEGVSINSAVNTDSPHYPGYTPLHFATKFFAFETVEILLAHGANRNLKDVQGLTPLHLLLERSIKYVKSMKRTDGASKVFTRSKFEKIIRLFLEEHEDNGGIVTDALGLSHFHCICTIQDRALIASYLNKVEHIDHCVNMNSPLFAGFTALHFAALFSIQNVKLLIQRGASMEAKDANGLTPFDICVEIYAEKEIYSVLMMHSTWKDIVLTDGYAESSSISVQSNSTKLVDLVLAMNDAKKLSSRLKTLRNGAKISISMESSLWPGFTPLHIAVMFSEGSDKQRKFSNVIKQLYNHGADLNCRDIKGVTPLNLAFRQEKFDVVELLLSLRRECQPIDVVDEDGLSHLHVMCYISSFGYRSAMLNVLSKVIDINISYKGKSAISCVTPGSSPLHVAVATSQKWDYIPQVLLKHGADILAKDSNGMTPIHLAMTRDDRDKGDESFAAKLLSMPSLRDSVVDDIQLSHLHVACYANHKTAVEKLIEQGADVNKAIVRRTKKETDAYFDKFVGFTPLRFAVMNDNESISMLLMQHGANIFTREPNGMTPLYAALSQRKPDIFVFALIHDMSLQKQIFYEDGITMLHIAICSSDIEMVEIALDQEADVNAQVSSRSPIWPGFTPLHVLMFYNELRHSKHNDVDGKGTRGENIMLNLLLRNNADLTLSNSAHDTPLHIICKEWRTNCDDKICTRHKTPWLRMLLQAHRDFNSNPTNSEGISFFHLACAVGEVTVVQKFLEHGKVDVNQPIDHFSKLAPGCTPLHLAIKAECFTRFDESPQLEVVDLLLKCGANADTEDISGNTPLHDAVTHHYSVCEDYLERIVREGADVNKHNVRGETPLEILLNREKVPLEKVKYFLKCGCRLNVINPVTGKNLWTLTLSSMTFEEVEKLIFITSVNYPELLETDPQNRNIIHNIAAVSHVTAFQWKYSEVYKYSQLIQRVSKKGCDIDDQDNLGRTALHFAAKSFNHHAVSTLLKYGADINILNSLGQTAFSTAFGNNEEFIGGHVYSTAQTLVRHVEQLLFCGIYVNEINRDLAQKIYDRKLVAKQSMDERSEYELQEISKMKIGSLSLTLGDFLSEVGAVSDYPGMSQTNRNVIDRFFKTRDWCFYRDYSKVVGLFLLQHRKAQARVAMVKRADVSLTVLAGYGLPSVCSHMIFKRLTNFELNNLIASAL